MVVVVEVKGDVVDEKGNDVQVQGKFRRPVVNEQEQPVFILPLPYMFLSQLRPATIRFLSSTTRYAVEFQPHRPCREAGLSLLRWRILALLSKG